MSLYTRIFNLAESEFKTPAEKRENWFFRRYKAAETPEKEKQRFGTWKKAWDARKKREGVVIPKGAWSID